MGKGMFTIIGAMAELERNVIRERIVAGLEHAKAHGTKSGGAAVGRPRAVFDRARVVELRDAGRSWRRIALALSVGVATVCRAYDQGVPKPSVKETQNRDAIKRVADALIACSETKWICHTFARNPLSRGIPETCPVRTIQAWTAQAGVTAGPLFRSINRHGRVQPGRLSIGARSTWYAAAIAGTAEWPMSTAINTPTFGRILSARDPRVLQMALKFII
jgi:hypothetical protein